MLEQITAQVVGLKERWSSPRGKWGRVIALSLALLAVGFFLGQAASADPGVLPGSQNDPLVTASWVEAKINAFSQALKEEQRERQILEDRMRKIEAGGVEVPAPGGPIYISAPAPTFEVVVVASGKKMLTGSGTEFIMRSGRATAVDGPGGGLSDLTAGRNLASGAPITRDHLILSPRDDGRGILTSSEAIFLVRGDYKIE